jgi:hypothetical protein
MIGGIPCAFWVRTGHHIKEIEVIARTCCSGAMPTIRNEGYIA